MMIDRKAKMMMDSFDVGGDIMSFGGSASSGVCKGDDGVTLF